ncbi:MAG TPA: YsnF/AvaK domain-containing protein [Paracoccus sp. (in: a-proteobacteria)]|nr:YsnF/AvaK domain-containing protein [Paracoccus sp. (in: a-proteobacteria)]
MAMETYSSSGATRSLSAMFDTRAEADRAVAQLQAAGIADVVLTGGENEGYGTVSPDTAVRDRGFFESIGDFFFPEEDRQTYAEGLNRGGYLVTVSNIPPDQYETALDILDNEGAIDLEAREAEWRSEGWAGYDSERVGADSISGDSLYGGRGTDRTLDTAAGAGLTGDTLAGGYADTLAGAGEYRDRPLEGDLNNDGTIDVVEERILVSKREAAAGRVRVRSYVLETPVEQDVELRSERVHIERRPVDRPAGDADFREQTIEAREYTETPVVQKEARVVEEINLNKDVESHVETVRDTVRKTEVEIEDDRDTIPGGNPDRDRT